jgi:hypothetical protein
MKKFLLIIFLLLSIQEMQSQTQGAKFSFNLSQDPVFGLIPTAKICLPINNDSQLLFYGKIWESKEVTDTLGNIVASPEFGVGIVLPFFEKKLQLTPYLGIGNGNYHSGGGNSVFLDYLSIGLYANLFNFNKLSINSEFNGRFYIRNAAYIRPKINEFQWQINPEYNFYNEHKIGIFLSQYILHKKYWASSATFTQFFWTGLSYRISIPQAYLWFSAGIDLVDYFDSGVSSQNKQLKDFYKLMINFNL